MLHDFFCALRNVWLPARHMVCPGKVYHTMSNRTL